MAGQQGYQTKHIRLVAFLALLCLATGLARRVALLPRSPLASPRPNWSTHSRELVQPNSNLEPPTHRLDPIRGRWEAIRLSLGLPSLPRGAVLPPGPNSASPGRPNKRMSRFDLGRKRWAARQLPRLHFAHDIRPAHPSETEAATSP